MKTAVRAAWPGVVEAYRDRMPVEPGWKIVTLGEGGTPLLPAPALSDARRLQTYSPGSALRRGFWRRRLT